MTAKRPGVAASPKGQKYEGQEVQKRPRKNVEATLYNGRKPDMAAGDHRDLQKPQDPIERRAKDYDNDVSLKGDRAWLRGGGEGHRPGMDRGKYDISDQPDRRAAGGSRNTATGRDMAASPFSAAHAASRDENDWNPNLKLKPIR
jgi:hypothetical protein